MLIDTHCHLNMIVKKKFDIKLTNQEIVVAKKIINDAHDNDVTTIINVGTSISESDNCITLAQTYKNCFATIGVHPNDIKNWKEEYAQLKKWLQKKEELKIVGIGECGIDKHYSGYNLNVQHDVFKAQIELALENDLALVVHSRDAYDETLSILEEYKNDITRCIIHCFSYDQQFANIVISWGFHLGIGGTITYPKNNALRDIVTNTPLEQIVLETDAPFLPIQEMRGKQNHPKYIKDIAEYIANLKNCSYKEVAQQTTLNATSIFNLK